MNKTGAVIAALLLTLILIKDIFGLKQSSFALLACSFSVLEFIILKKLFSLTAHVEFIPRRRVATIRIYVLLQVLPLAFVLLDVPRVSLSDSSLFLVVLLFILFFFIGQTTWSELHKHTASAMYGVFMRANRTIIVPISVFTLLGLFLSSRQWADRALQVIFMYSCVHVYILWPVSLKIKNDLKLKTD